MRKVDPNVIMLIYIALIIAACCIISDKATLATAVSLIAATGARIEHGARVRKQDQDDDDDDPDPVLDRSSVIGRVTPKPPSSTGPVLALVALLLMTLGGCSQQAQVRLITVGSDIGTAQLLQKVKPADRAQVAQSIYTVVAAVKAATSDNPDWTAVNALVIAEVAKIKSPYAPLILELVQASLADAEAQATKGGTPSPQGETARQIIQAVLTGVQNGTLFYFTPPDPTTQPVVPIPNG